MQRSRQALLFALIVVISLALGLLIAAFVMVRGCYSGLSRSTCMQVLFIGNSYTSQHETVAELRELFGA